MSSCDNTQGAINAVSLSTFYSSSSSSSSSSHHLPDWFSWLVVRTAATVESCNSSLQPDRYIINSHTHELRGTEGGARGCMRTTLQQQKSQDYDAFVRCDLYFLACLAPGSLSLSPLSRVHPNFLRGLLLMLSVCLTRCPLTDCWQT